MITQASPPDAAASVLRTAVQRRVFPGAVAEIGNAERTLWQSAFGYLTFDEDAPLTGTDVIYDLASLTKPIATTMVVLDVARRHVLTLDTRVADGFQEWRGADREGVTVRDLLEHASGLPARLVDRPPSTRREFEHEICRIRLEYAPRSASLYSDLGFILLGFLAADRGQRRLDALFETTMTRVTDPLPAHSLTFAPPVERRTRTAPTWPLDEDARAGRMLTGEVHDNYAAALSGVAGHAGLFGTIDGVAAFARSTLRAARGDGSLPPPFTPDAIALATRQSAVPGSSRALGWDTMLPTSSCGTRMSPRAFGHVGFTGTSLWIDPSRDRYYVLLTNRACRGGTLDEMRDVRRAFHDAAADL